jgi:hypothetical protein
VNDRSQGAFLREIIHALDHAGIAYMVCGSLGSSFHGQPRATNDIDLVIAPTREQLDVLLGKLMPRFYADRGAALEALTNGGSFNVIEGETGWRADLIPLRNRPFSREEFSRRREAEILGLKLYVVSPEDAILSKLEWAKQGASERQLSDAAGIAATQGAALDRAYLARWANELGVAGLLEEILQEEDDPSERG